MNEYLETDKEKETSLLDHAVVLAKRMRLILRITLAIALLAIIVSLILPDIYEGQVTILPPEQGGSKSLTSALMSQIPGAIGMLAGLPAGMGSPADYCVSLLTSRTIADAIIDRFGLMELYEEDKPTDTRNRLSDVLEIEVDKKSLMIAIRVRDLDPKRSADMANAFVEELTKLDNKLAVADASQRRLFFEAELKEAHEGLLRAEEALKIFQETTGAIKIDSQAEAVLEGIATLRAQIAAKEIQIKVMNTYATPFNRQVRQVEEELSGMKEQLKKFEAKSENYSGNTSIPTDQIPSLATEYLRRGREFKFQESLFELLAKQYESARLDEANNMSTIRILDPAVVPDKRVSPRRTLMVVAATMMGFFFAVFWAYFREYLEKAAADSENLKRYAKIREYFLPLSNYSVPAMVKRMFKRKSKES